MINNYIIIINSDTNCEELIQKSINDNKVNKNIYLIASPNVRFIHEIIKYYEYSLKEWIIHPIDNDENIINLIKNFNITGEIFILPESYNHIKKVLK